VKPLVKNILYFVFSPFLIRRGKKDGIYITFDDGPHPDNTPLILSILNKTKSKATFFMVGSEMKKYPELVSAVIEQGHLIGYHSRNHRSLKKLTISEVIDDFSMAKSLEEKFNIKIKYYRPPYGDLTLFSFFYLVFTGWKIIMWSLNSMDSFDNIISIKGNVDVNKIEIGDIILFHDDYDVTSSILEEIIRKYRDNNIDLLRLDQ